VRPRLGLRPPFGVVEVDVEVDVEVGVEVGVELPGINEKAHADHVCFGGSVGFDGSIYTSLIGFSIYIAGFEAPILER
jgi:hypothetical protein